VPLANACPGVRLLLGTVDQVDLDHRWVGLVDPEGNRRRLDYDRLLLAASTPGCAASRCAGCCWSAPRACCPSWTTGCRPPRGAP
jgi:hypothetical protein